MASQNNQPAIRTLRTFALCLFGLGIAGVTDAQPYAKARLADGFDYPVGKPDGKGYYKARGLIPYAHAGDDWNGNGGGDTDLGDPVYVIGHGVVVYSEYYGGGFGHSVIVRHAYREKNGQIAFVDSLYTHLKTRLVKEGKQVTRGQQVGTIGKGPGNMYDAHLHFEIRKDLRVGMRSRMFPLTLKTYHQPELFIKVNRSLRLENRYVRVPIHTFMKSNPNRVTSEDMDLTEVIISDDDPIRPSLPTRLESIVDRETDQENTSPERSQSVFQKIFGAATGD